MKIWGMARGMAIGYGKANFLGYGKKKLGYGSRHTPEAEMTPLLQTVSPKALMPSNRK